MNEEDDPVEIGIDTGGTFTDVVMRTLDGDRIMKIPSTRDDPSKAVRAVLDHVRERWGVRPDRVKRFVHGSTIATNAVLERKGAMTGLLATEGFRDVLEIGRQMRRQMYDLHLKPETPVFLAPRALRAEVRERVTAQGEVLVPLDEDSLARAVDGLVARGVQSIAISFLFSFLHPAHEQAARRAIRERHPDIAVSLSSEVDPTFREYERTCVTAFDAYVKPVVERYLTAMERDLASSGIWAGLQVMQSRGGLAASAVARERPVRLFLSGPAAGVVGGRAVAQASGYQAAITLDVGGTSSDIALIAGGDPLVRGEAEIAGFPVRVPMLDIHTLGAGGGSIAWVDQAGGLRVGPHSAGADPGPACYGRGGEEATVTDASVVLGYLDPKFFAGGAIELDPERARSAISRRIAEPMGVSVEAAALGIHRILNAQMAEGMRLVSIKRGYDPREFVLVAMGGAGPLHGAALADELGIKTLLVPPHPGVLSAGGLLKAPIEHEVSIAFARSLEALDLEDARSVLADLDTTASALMEAEAVDATEVTRRHFADVCYVGQSFTLEVPFEPGRKDAVKRLYRDFLATHERVHGHATESPAQIVNLRSVHHAVSHGLGSLHEDSDSIANEAAGTRKIRLGEGKRPISAKVFRRSGLAMTVPLHGPAIIDQEDTTTLVPPGWRATRAVHDILVMERRGRG